MQTHNERNTFFDGRTLLAIVLVGFFWFAWERHLQEKYPEAYKEVEPREPVSPDSTSAKSKTAAAPVAAAPENKSEAIVNSPEKPKEDAPEVLTHFEGEFFKFDFTSIGMGLKNVVIKSYSQRDGSEVKVGLETGPSIFETNLIGSAEVPRFEVVKKSDYLYSGTAQQGPVTIKKDVTINPKDYSIKVDVKLTGIVGEPLAIKTIVSDVVKPIGDVGFWSAMTNPNYDYQHYYAAFDNKTEDAYLMSGFEFKNKNFNELKAMSFGSQYFVTAIVDKSGVIPKGEISWKDNNKFLGSVVHEMVNKDSSFEISYLGYIGPKDLDIVTRVEPSLTATVDFGMFSAVGRPLLMIMKFFYGIFNNYGVAIIMLTLFVRLLIFPLNMMGFKSMKKMQVIQPQLKAINEKFKNDPQAKNLATMALFKENKVNPMGGCLPMLLQLPIFFALYQVFATSIELYRAPFGLWIHDLSYKDPYYVLPVAMAVVMFIQQWVTPTTMDPQQKKVMMFMPLMFSVFMLNLPSGLSLYMFVSGLFGVLQQMYFMRDTSATAVTKLEIV